MAIHKYKVIKLRYDWIMILWYYVLFAVVCLIILIVYFSSIEPKPNLNNPCSVVMSYHFDNQTKLYIDNLNKSINYENRN